LRQALASVIEELVDGVFHGTDQYADNRVERDHGRLKVRLPMRGLKTDRTAAVVIAGHGLIQNLRRGHYEPGVEAGLTSASPQPSTSSPKRSEPPRSSTNRSAATRHRVTQQCRRDPSGDQTVRPVKAARRWMGVAPAGGSVAGAKVSPSRIPGAMAWWAKASTSATSWSEGL